MRDQGQAARSEEVLEMKYPEEIYLERVKVLEAENELLRGLVRGWHYLAVGPDEMGDYYTQKMLIKASEPYAHPALAAINGWDI
jgi:hypothetical protein